MTVHASTSATTVVAENWWDIYRVAAPRFYAALEPLREHAPQALQRQAVKEALLALYMARPESFRAVSPELPTIIAHSRALQELANGETEHRKHPRKALCYGIRTNPSERPFVWPKIEAGLRELYTKLPRQLHLPGDLERHQPESTLEADLFIHVSALLLLVVNRDRAVKVVKRRGLPPLPSSCSVFCRSTPPPTPKRRFLLPSSHEPKMDDYRRRRRQTPGRFSDRTIDRPNPQRLEQSSQTRRRRGQRQRGHGAPLSESR